MDEDDEKENRGKSEKFPEDELVSGNRLGDDEVHGFTLYLAEQELTPYEDNRDNPKYFNHRKTEIDDNLVSLSERECRKYERKGDEYHPEKHDHIEDLVAGKFSECIESDIEHSEKIIKYFRYNPGVH